MFTMEEIKIANATSRSNGASARNKDGSIRAVVPRYVAERISKKDSILDFGAGKAALHTKWLRGQGFNVTAYDFGDNIIEGVHDRDALSKQYKVIMMSNVLNVQSSREMLDETLQQVYNSLEPGGVLICNYPASPRKMRFFNSTSMIIAIEKVIKGCKVYQIGGSSSAPVWHIWKPRLN